MIKSAEDPAANDKGPFFKDADGKAVRTLADLTTGADGVLKLPKIFADDQTGTFLLRLTTAGGASVTIELKVVAPERTVRVARAHRFSVRLTRGTAPTAPPLRHRSAKGRCYVFSSRGSIATVPPP